MLTKTNNGFSVEGDITFDNIAATRLAGNKLITGSYITIDLSNMKNSNAVSLVLLLAWMREAKIKKSELKFLHAATALKSMTEAFGLKNIIELS